MSYSKRATITLKESQMADVIAALVLAETNTKNRAWGQRMRDIRIAISLQHRPTHNIPFGPRDLATQEGDEGV